jgi:hypothetical protein
VKAALVSIDTEQVWVLADLRPDEDRVLASRFAVCEDCGAIAPVAVGSHLGPGERWAAVADLPAVLRQ